MNREEMDIIAQLEEYKANVARRDILKNDMDDDPFIKAMVLSDMPSAHGEVFSKTEAAAISDQPSVIELEIRSLSKEIKRVDIWLNFLLEEEKFAVINFYMEKKTYRQIIRKWDTLHGVDFSKFYWRGKKISGIKKIAYLSLK